jgi:hypothetical protein
VCIDSEAKRLDELVAIEACAWNGISSGSPEVVSVPMGDFVFSADSARSSFRNRSLSRPRTVRANAV